MIFAYPQRASLSAGDELALHVSTDSPAFRVELHRFGRAPARVHRSGWLEGADVPHHLPYQDWSEPGAGLHGEELAPWPAYFFPVGRDWQPGVYVATLVEGDGSGRDAGPADVTAPDARSGKALFVLRGAERRPGASLLYKLPLFTYQAYNLAGPRRYDPRAPRGGWCLYSVPGAEQLPVEVPPSVSLRRPGGGTGGTPFDISNFDPFDPTPRQTFVHWDAPAIVWLEEQGFAPDYCTDLDLHEDDELRLLSRYRLLLSFGHDEYWSDRMRRNAECFVARGGNIAFFSGNTCWWRVVFDDDVSFRRAENWSEQPFPNDPENRLTGVSFRNGGERDRDDFPLPVGYRVQHADHWSFAGTGLGDGDVFGAGRDEYLVGYECDGAHFDRRDVARGLPVRPSGEDGTPEDFLILGVGDVGASGWGFGNRAATMGTYTRGGTVFTSATTDWARLLARPGGAVARITHNVLERLG